MRLVGVSGWACALALSASVWAALASPVRSETLESALVRAYLNNPSLNAQRASVRATDEGVPQALSGYRPKVTVTATGGQQSVHTRSKESSGLSSSRPLTCT